MQATSSTPADNINSVQDAADAAKSAMVSIIGLDSDKVQKLCDAANEEVDEANKVQIANFLCPVSSSKSFVAKINSISTLQNIACG